MSNPVREHLIGYLLGAVEPEEAALVEQHVNSDEVVRRELELLRTSLHPLQEDKGHHEPPSGLAQRCCEHVYSRTEIMPAALSRAGGAAVAKRRWTWLEIGVAGAIAASVAVLMLPKIFQSQLAAQLLACQNNLKDIGYAAANYSQHHEGYYPVARPDEQINTAGSWAPKLKQYVDQPGRTFVCPSSPLAVDSQFRVPSMEELKAMSKAQQEALAPLLSGSYGITLGYHDPGTGAYKLPRHENKPRYAVAADIPGKNGTNSPNHGQRGQNVLWGDGRVTFETSPESESGADNFYSNAQHEVAAGLNADDSAIVPSELHAK